MSRVRSLAREDLPAVASLYELVFRSRTSDPPPGLASYFERLFFDHPFVDPELPALVYDEPGEGIVGFIASYPRPFVYRERSLRMGGTGQFVTHPNVRSRGVGALLLRSYLAGAQDFTITDGRPPHIVRAMWERLGGVVNPVASIEWRRVLVASKFLRAAHWRGWGGARGQRAWTALNRIVGRSVRPVPPTGTYSEPLTVDVLLEGVSLLREVFPLRPNYDARSLKWLFRELDAVAPARGPLLRQVVRSPEGRILGWYLVLVPRGQVANTLQLVGKGDDVGLVLDQLFHEVAERGAIAIRGGTTPYLYPYLQGRRCVLDATSSWALVHTRDPALLGTILSGRGLITRLDSERWVSAHRLDAAALAKLDTAGTNIDA